MPRPIRSPLLLCVSVALCLVSMVFPASRPLADVVAPASGSFSELPHIAQQDPPEFQFFYGSVEINGQPAPVGSKVEARGPGVITQNDNPNVKDNPLTLTFAGQYGVHPWGTLDPKLLVQGYIQEGTPIEFYVNGVRAECAVPGGAWGSSYPFTAERVTALNLRVSTRTYIPMVGRAEAGPTLQFFYGAVTVNGQPAPVGTQVEARGVGVANSRDIPSIQWNPLIVTDAGRYGGLGVVDSMLLVQGIPGISLESGTPIEFYVNGVRAECAVPGGAWGSSYPFTNGAVTELQLRAMPSDPGQTWTIMLYQVADDRVLEQDIYIDLNEMERVGPTDRVHMVAQIDRYRGGFSGDGNWTQTRRYVIEPDQDLTRVGSKLIGEGELNMSAGETLVNFVTWTAKNYPANNYVLILSGHGLGWPGGWSDPDPGQQGQSIDRSIPLHLALGDQLYLNELDAALEEARQQADIDKFELIGLDACLMGHIEVMDALASHGRYAVFSQETEPALGWAYTAFLSQLVKNPDMSGAELGQQIVSTYVDQDERILDDQARTEWIGQSSTMGGASAAQIRQQLGRGVTLTAVDLEKTPALIESVNQLASAMQNADQRGIAKARRYAQSFTSIFGQQVPPSYIDLGHFLILLTQATDDPQVNAAASNVAQAITETVVAEKSGKDKPGATGISIYFPPGQAYQQPAAGPQSYTAIASRFTQDSLWDEFLLFHYGDLKFEAGMRTSTASQTDSATGAPGTGQIRLSPVEKDKSEVAIGDTVLLSTNVSGENIGYIYFYAGYLDGLSNSIAILNRDYLKAPETREADGVYYPDWGEGDFKLEFAWEPIVYAITDGVTRAQAALMPETYGAPYEDTIYTVDGTYTYQDGEQSYARAYFRDGLLRQVFAFTHQDSNPGAPRAITDTAGDKFTVTETRLESDGQGGTRLAKEAGETLTLQVDNPFRWEELNATAGEYVVGFIATDLEGHITEAHTTVTVLP